MKIQKSFFGYDPAAVEQEVRLRQQKCKQAQEEQNIAIKIAIKEQEQLERQLNDLQAQLETARQSSTLIQKFQDNLADSLTNARIQSEIKNRQILAEVELFEHEVEKTIPGIENEINKIKREIKSVVKVINDVFELADFKQENQYSQITTIDNVIMYLERKLQQTYENPYKELSPKNSGMDLLQQLLSSCISDETRKMKENNPEIAPAVDRNVAKTTAVEEILKGFRPRTVLIAEDDENTSNLLRDILEREGFEVIIAADGHEVSRMINEISPPGLVLLNIVLPHVDGFQVIRQIRSKPQWDTVPVIALTSNSSEFDTIDALDSGASDCIKKPFNPEELIIRIRRFCNY